MSEITYRYFLATGDKADRVIQEIRDGLRAHREKSEAVCDKYGATATWGRSAAPPFALAFEGDQHATKKPGFKEPTTVLDKDKRYHIHAPHRSTKIGKGCAQLLATLKPFDYSEHAAKSFGLMHSICGISGGRMCIAFTSAGFYGNQLVFRVPVGGEDGDNITPPPGVRELKHSEFIAITEEGAEVPA